MLNNDIAAKQAASYRSDVDKWKSDLGSGYAKVIDQIASQSNNYHDSLWDRIGDFFGFNTKQDQYRLDFANRQQERINQLYNQKREEDYNDPTSQVARERAAGLNPDINGSITPGTAAESTEAELPGSPEGTDPMTLIQSFSQVFSFGINFASQITDLAQKGLGLSAGRVALRESITNQAITDWDNVVASWNPEDVLSEIKYSTAADRYSRDPSVGATNPYRRGSHEFRAYANAAKVYRLNHPAVARKYFDYRNGLSKAVMNYSTDPIRSVRGFDESGDYSKVLDCFSPLSDLVRSTMEATTRNENTEANSTIPAELDARESAAKLSKQRSDKSYDIGSTISQIISKLSDLTESDKASDGAKLLAHGMLMAMYFFGSKFGIQ